MSLTNKVNKLYSKRRNRLLAATPLVDKEVEQIVFKRKK